MSLDVTSRVPTEAGGPAPIKVLWVIDHVCYDGSLHGGGRLYWNVLPMIDAERFRVVPCLLRASEEIRALFEQSPVPTRILDKGKFDPSTLTAFLRLIRREKIQVMHLHCYGASAFGRLASLMTGVPCIIHDYDTAVYFPYPWYLWLADRLLAPATRRAVAASPMVRDYFIERRGVDPEKISAAFHAVPQAKFLPVAEERIRRLREQLGIGAEKAIVGTVTKLGPERGNRHLLRSVAKVAARFPEIVLVMVYKTTEYHRPPDAKYVDLSSAEPESRIEDLEAEIREQGLESRVRLVEAPEDLDTLIASFDLFVAPFLSDRFSSVNLLEAMAMSKAVVATDVGEPREIVVDGVNGRLVPKGDEEALAESLLGLLKRPEDLETLNRGARATAESNSVDAYARRLEGWYEELAGAAKGSRAAS